MSILCFALIVFLFKKYGGRLSGFGIILAIVLAFIDIPFHIFSFHDTLVSFPELIARLLAVGFGYLYIKISKLSVKIIFSVIIGSLYIWFAYDGYIKYWNFRNFGSFTGKTEQIVENPVTFQNETGEEVKISDFKGKYLLLDFWYTGCGFCMKAFPKVQTLYDEVKDLPDIKLYSVFCRMSQEEETHRTGQDILNQRGYSFPSLSMDMNDPVLKEMGVTGFPTVLIFDPDGKLIFRGGVLNLPKNI